MAEKEKARPRDFRGGPLDDFELKIFELIHHFF